MLGIWESLLIIAVVFFLVLWLGKKSPDIARNVGKSIKEFKQGMNELPNEIKQVNKEIKK